MDSEGAVEQFFLDLISNQVSQELGRSRKSWKSVNYGINDNCIANLCEGLTLIDRTRKDR